MQKEMIEKNAILKPGFDFSLMLIDYSEKLEEKRKFVLSKQVLRSGTTIGAKAFEAQNGESKADLIHENKIAAKEADETRYWLTLCDYAQNYPECKSLLAKPEEIQKILNKIIGTAKRKNPLSYFISFFIF